MAAILARLVPHTQAIMGVGVAVVASWSMYSQTLGLGSYRQVVGQYRDGNPQPLDEKTAELAEKVLISLLLSPEEEAGIEFFTVYGQDSCHRGSCKLRTGAIIGLPGTFAYNSPDQVQTEQILVNNRLVDWDSRGGELLLRSIVLSGKAKAFAITREVQYANTYHVWTEAMLQAGFVLAAYMLGFWVNTYFRFGAVLKRWARGSVYGLIGVSAYMLYVVLDDTYYCHRDHVIDRRVCRQGKDLAEGGAEFYTKLLQRNMALRLLLGSEGERRYTTFGNEAATWRRPHAMLSERRDYFVKYLEELGAREAAAVEDSESSIS